MSSEHEQQRGVADSFSHNPAVDTFVAAPVSEELEQLFDIEIICPQKLFYAFSHNRIPLVRQLSIASIGSGVEGALRVELALNWTREDRAPAKPHTFIIDAPTEVGQAVVVGDVPLKLEDVAMVDLEEAVPATLVLTITTQEGRRQQLEVEVQILARNQWALVPGYEDLLASYVQPNHPVTKDILKSASQILKERTGSASIEGYQSGPERAREIGKAVFEAFQAWELTYINPPASFEVFQKVRPLDEVLEGEAGTCIDLACAYASCLEQAGLRPLIWVVPGHAFAGFLLEETHLDSSVVRDTNVVLNLTDSGLAVAVEAVCLTDGKQFEAAIEETRLRLLPTDDLFVIDVHRAHRSGALPLPARVVRDGIVTIVVDPGPGAAPAIEQRVLATGKRLTDSVPLRVTRWKSSLLDLTFRNPLLGFSTRRQGLDLLVPKGKLAALENDLMAGKALKVMPGDKLEGAQTAAGLRSITEASTETTVELYENLNLLYTPSGETEGAKRSRALANRARLLESETGANSLYLVLGKLVWRRKVRGQETAEVESPLFLLPVKLIRARGSALFHVVADDEALTTPNYCLIEKLKVDFGLHVPEFERPALDSSGIDLMASIQGFRKALQNRGLPFRVDETAHLAILQYSKFRLWKDMDEHWEKFLENDVVRHMAESAGLPFESSAPNAHQELSEEDELEVLCPVPADGAQLRAIARALRGDSFVLQGPPGTGKSQTITNLLASALARGKKVLFVAEKQAALSVVRDRLESVGLAPYFLDLHDKGSKPQQIRDQLKTALESVQYGDDKEFREVQGTLAALQKRLAFYRDSLYEENPQRFSYASAYEESLRLKEGLEAEVPTAILFEDPAKIDHVLQSLREVEAAIDAAKPSPHHPWHFVPAADFSTIDRPALAASLRTLQQEHEAGRGVPTEVRSALKLAKSTPDLRDLNVVVAGLENDTIPSQEVRDAILAGTYLEQVGEAIAQLRKPAERIAQLRRELGSHAFDRPLDEVDQSLLSVMEASESFFLVRRGKTRSALQEMLGADTPPKRSWEECRKIAEEVVGVRKAFRRRLADLQGAAIDDLPSSFRAADTSSYESVEKWMDGLIEIALVCAREDEFGAQLREVSFNTQIAGRGAAGRLSTLADAIDEFFELLPGGQTEITAWLDGRSLQDVITEQLPAWLADSTEDRFLRLKRWMDLSTALEPAREVGLGAFVNNILAGEVPAEEAGIAFSRGLANASIRERAVVNGLDTFDRVSHESVIKRYTEALSRRQDVLKETIPKMLLDSRSFNANAGHGEIRELKVELNKKRNAKSVRQLLADYPTLIQQLTPCFLMSPTSVAQFIEPGSMEFDLVVFDEASQIDVAEAVGAMGRAKAVVIVGDSKQMPPTRMFDAGVGQDDVFSSANEDEDEVPEDGESLLIEAVDSIQMEQEWLSWHYRSQDETLIAFSNVQYYDSALSSFPSPHTGRRAALSWHPVPGGQFSHGKQRTNIVEAEAVVQEIVRRVNDPASARDSIGVVTLNRQQQDEILRLLEETDDSKVQDLLNSDTDESLLVRNLENIQGQERDVIILSTGFSKPEGGGKLPLNFGPLNRQGGERRLNVAITRARRELLVFCSFEPEDIEEGRSSAKGLHDLKAFLEMAKYGPSRSRVASSENESLELYRDEVKRALEERGLEVQVDMGLSPFKVDLAARSKGSDEWRAAILLDGGRWSRRRSAVDRDALPVTVLRHLMGWPAVLRVWLPAWRAEREAIIDELVKAVIAAPPPRTEVAGEEVETARPEVGPYAETLPLEDDKYAPPPIVPEPAPAADSWRPIASSSGVVTGLAVAPEHELFVPYPPTPLLATQEEWDINYLPPHIAAHIDGCIQEALACEGPIELDRLAKLVALRLGFNRLHKTRGNIIKRRVPKKQVRTNRLGKFVWPEGINPDAYTEFRRSPDGLRAIEEIAPEELGNAMNHLAREANSVGQDELLRTTAELFGIKRMTGNVTRHLEAACAEAVDSGRLTLNEDRYFPGPFPNGSAGGAGY